MISLEMDPPSISTPQVKTKKSIKFQDEVTTFGTPRKSKVVDKSEKTPHKMSDNSTGAGNPEVDSGSLWTYDEWSSTQDDELQPSINNSKQHPPRWKILYRKHRVAILDMGRKDGSRKQDGTDVIGVTDSLSGLLETRYLGSSPDQSRILTDSGHGRSSDTFMRAAIPYLPKSAAVLCLVANILLPGMGTVMSGLLVFFCGEVRMTTKAGGRISTFCVNLAVGSMQMLTVPFLLVGWIWSLVWGIYFILLSDEKMESLKKLEEKNVKAKILSAFDPSFRAWTAN